MNFYDVFDEGDILYVYVRFLLIVEELRVE